MSRTTKSLLAKLKKEFPDAVYITAEETASHHRTGAASTRINGYVALSQRMGKAHYFIMSEGTTPAEAIATIVASIKEQYNAEETT